MLTKLTKGPRNQIEPLLLPPSYHHVSICCQFFIQDEHRFCVRFKELWVQGGEVNGNGLPKLAPVEKCI